MQIKAISSWQNGQEKLGTEFELRSISDNLATSATFYYSISNVEVSHLEPKTVTTLDGEELTENVLVIDAPAQVLVDGNLTMDGEDYQLWNEGTNVNFEAYSWALAKLNLVAEVK